MDYCGEVDGINVPIPHFGCVIEIVQFKEIQEKQESSDIKFVVKPQTRYEGKVGEQMTMFVFDYSGSPLEFKAFADPKEIFAV